MTTSTNTINSRKRFLKFDLSRDTISRQQSEALTTINDDDYYQTEDESSSEAILLIQSHERTRVARRIALKGFK